MSIKIKKEPDELGPPYEKCIFCRNPTPFWSEEKDVPVCENCAKIFEEAKVPTKEQWFLLETNYDKWEDED